MEGVAALVGAVDALASGRAAKGLVESESSVTWVGPEVSMAMRWTISSALFNWPMWPKVKRHNQVPAV